MIATIRQAFDLIGRDQWRKWGFLILLALVASGFEMIGAILVFVLVGLAANPSGQIDIPVVGDIRSIVGDVNDDTLLLWTIGIIAVFFVARGIVQIGTAYYQKRVAENAGASISIKLVRGYLHLPYPVHLQRGSAELIRNSHSVGLQLVAQVFIPVINIAAQTLLTLGLLAVLVAIAPLATLLVIITVGGAATLVLLIVQPRLKHLGAVSHQMQKETLGSLQQALEGIRDIKLFSGERYFAHRYSRSRLVLARVLYLRRTWNQVPTTIIESALIGFILVFLGVSVVSGDQTQQALPVLGLFAYVGLRLLPSVQRIVSGLNDIRYSSAPVADLHRDLLEVQAISSPDEEPDPLPFTDELVLDNVSFRYEEADRDALTAIDLIIHPGEEIGICGPTGGGKSTLVDIITGLLQPTDGRVTVDGVDIRNHAREWQRNLGVVSQMIFLTDDTLRRNIALGISDDEIDEEALKEAVDLAQLTEFVTSLPDGLETTVGERGVRISGGQRQRIAIARALYQRPQVLIFDEGTSALDNVVEAALLSSLENLRGTHTILHIAHRLSTVRRSDRVIYIEEGQVTGTGSYDELVVSHDGFRRMNAAESQIPQ